MRKFAIGERFCAIGDDLYAIGVSTASGGELAMTEINPRAATGFGNAAAAYASGRPDYPQALIGWLKDTLKLGRGKTVLDLGAGTGKFTARLLDADAFVIAIEPVQAMRLELVKRFRGVDAREGTAEHIPVPDASVDAVTCAQSFHWFAGPAALAEIKRVLRPGGYLGLVWNLRDEGVAWVKQIADIVEAHREGVPHHEQGAWRHAFPAEGFGEPEETRFGHVHRGPASKVILDRMMSISFIASMPKQEQEKVKADLQALIANTPELAGKDEIEFPYETLAVAIQKRG
jgi:SAM-dependent methyltransferase